MLPACSSRCCCARTSTRAARTVTTQVQRGGRHDPRRARGLRRRRRCAVRRRRAGRQRDPRPPAARRRWRVRRHGRPRRRWRAASRCAASPSPRTACALVVSNARAVRRGRTEQLALPHPRPTTGDAVRDFDVEHTKRMHLIVVRRDLTGFQHLHPTQAADGTWTVAGAPRATPAPTACSPTSRTTATAHDARRRPARRRRRRPARRCRRPRPRRRATAATTCASTAAPPHAGDGGRRCASRSPATGGRSQTEPYLGAGGHLVALREGDLAFLHVHPTEDDGRSASRPTFPTAGRYRLFLQFKADGRVHTAAFTQEVTR